MRRVGIKALKNSLSEYVRAAASGETVLVTDRDRVVAELVPPRRAETAEEAVLARGIREGWITPPSIHHSVPVLEPASIGSERECLITFERLMADLAQDREDR